ncbi:hypothetical protein LTR85_008395 [Meristemomyces frigidus]|nr:hypothetical protein LTR85_008395 [Meristemomyces frigidus]
MPHAISDETMGDTDEQDAIQRYLQGQGPEGGAEGFLGREINQADKAQDAVDYEDISDEDDLPDEEDATQRVGDGDASGFLDDSPNGFGSLQDLPYTNGYHEDQPQPTSDDLFGNDVNDLFGELPSSPRQERQPEPPQPPVQRRPGGLALPSKSGLALPGYTGTYQQVQQAQPVQHPRPRQPQYSPPSLSPPSFGDDGYSQTSPASMPASEDEDEGETDEAVLAQRKLFRQAAHKVAGREFPEEREQVEMDVFYTLFPGYEEDQNPRFVEFFPPRAVQYRGKVPVKPPKPVQPTKLSLELLPDQERSFKSAAPTKTGLDVGYGNNIVVFPRKSEADDETASAVNLGDDDAKPVGGMNLEDFALICEDWDLPSFEATSVLQDEDEDEIMDGGYEAAELARPVKKRKTNFLDASVSVSETDLQLAFKDPERAAAKVAKAHVTDFNDPHLLIDEHPPQNARKTKRIAGDLRRDSDLTRDLARRYNISNDEAYDLLKENHQHKVRSTLGGLAIEHSLPATKLQYPFYKVSLDPKAKRSFHRPPLDLRLRMAREEFRMGKMKTIKRKERKGREVKELFATSESLSLNDNSSMLLLEYSEEAPIMLSNFGMGSRLINFYRKRNADDTERPKRDIGETLVLLTQDKSPFSNFGHVDQGEIVPTVQNSLFRAPVFQHQSNPTDFFVAISTTHGYGSRMYLRNMENLHTVGQQFPIAEVPGEHSRRVTDAAKKRLRALAYRIYTKSQDPTRRGIHLDNASIMQHLKGHDMPQTRSKMREFMKYERVANRETGVWVPPPGQVVPDSETLRTWVKPEDVCVLDSMQVGVQHLKDLGLTNGKDGDDEKDVDENANIELQLAPWRATKNFLGATQGKTMLKLHGEGDPTGRGEGFSFVKTSMKGGFQTLGESVEDKISAKKRRENGGHSYNVASQQKAYDDFIRTVWDKQKHSLSSNIEISDTEMEDDIDAEPDSAYRTARAATPRSSFAGTPVALARRDDETGTQFSRASADRHHERVLIIQRTGGRDAYGNADETIEKVTNPRVIREYKRRRNEKRMAHIDIMQYQPNGVDPELDALVKVKVDEELKRIQKNSERRQHRENQKVRAAGGAAGSPSASVAGSPGPSDIDGPAFAINGSTDVTPQKGRGRNKDGTARKCANCGQVGHIKTNRKLVYTFICTHCGATEKIGPGGVVKREEPGGGRDGASPAGSPRKGNATASSFMRDSYSKFEL